MVSSASTESEGLDQKSQNPDAKQTTAGPCAKRNPRIRAGSGVDINQTTLAYGSGPMVRVCFTGVRVLRAWASRDCWWLWRFLERVARADWTLGSLFTSAG